MNVEMWGEVYYVYNVSKIHYRVAAGTWFHEAESISLPDGTSCKPRVSEDIGPDDACVLLFHRSGHKEDLIMPRAMLNNLIMAGGAKEVKKPADTKISAASYQHLLPVADTIPT